MPLVVTVHDVVPLLWPERYLRYWRRVQTSARLTAVIGRPQRRVEYNGQVHGQQTRFNHHIVLYARRLEDRVAELEARVATLERERGDG